MQESLRVLDEVRLNFSTGGLLVLYITLAYIMLCMIQSLLFNPKVFPVDLSNGGMAFITVW